VNVRPVSRHAGPQANRSFAESVGHGPLLIDPFLLGVPYAPTGAILADPYSAMERNGVGLRLEIEALLHVRSPMGTYVISS
jgi:hypothetical protein